LPGKPRKATITLKLTVTVVEMLGTKLKGIVARYMACEGLVVSGHWQFTLQAGAVVSVEYLSVIRKKELKI